MIFESIIIRDGIEMRRINFSNLRNVVFSHENSVGKSTLLRIIVFSMGYPVPGTRGLNFKNLETELRIQNFEGKLIVLTRKDNYLTLESSDKKTFDLVDGNLEILREIFGDMDIRVLSNLLGTFYLDQDKGWTLLNKGKVIGDIRFDLRNLILGLGGANTTDLENSIKDLESSSSKYKMINDLIEFQENYDTDISSSFNDLSNLDIEVERERITIEKSKRKVINYKKVLEKNENLIVFLEELNLTVKDSLNNSIPVNKGTIQGFEMNQEFIKSRFLYEKVLLEKSEKRLQDLIKKKDEFYNNLGVYSQSEKIASDISRLIAFDATEIEKMLKSTKKEKRKLTQSLNEKIECEKEVIGYLHSKIVEYISHFGLDKILSEKERRSQYDFIFTSDLKSISGTNLHLLVFCFKMGYIKMIENFTGCRLPIILDSPSGREVSAENIEAINQLLIDNFKSSQIIIATINKEYFNYENLVLINGRLLDRLD